MGNKGGFRQPQTSAGRHETLPHPPPVQKHPPTATAFPRRFLSAKPDVGRRRPHPIFHSAPPEADVSVSGERLRDLLTQATNVLRCQTELIRRYDPCVPLPSTALRGLGIILQNVEGMLIDAYILYDEQ